MCNPAGIIISFTFSSVPITQEIEEVWDDSIEPDSLCELVEPLSTPVPSASSPDASPDATVKSLIAWLTGFLLILQAAYSTSDAVIGALLKFLKVFFKVLGPFSEVIAKLASTLPSSVYSLRKATNDLSQSRKFVVCPCCHKLYHFAECVDISGRHQTSKKCAFIRFPRHPLLSKRSSCGSLLLKTVTLSSGCKSLQPIKVYPYKTLFSSLQQLLSRSGFVDLCRHWEHRSTVSELKSDVYDGKIWQDFQTVDGKPFLCCKDSLGLGLTLNVDWFQPFKHSTYSVGAKYLTVMNLPRSVRYKRKNVILVGILPGPCEPKGNINSYLEPLIEELQDFWTGVKLNVNSGPSVSQTIVRCALMCVACDLPAGRMLCGFLGHSAKLGCSKCFKKFPGSAGSMDYSGFARESWVRRTNEEHRDRVKKVSSAKSKAEQNTLESKLGCRFLSWYSYLISILLGC